MSAYVGSSKNLKDLKDFGCPLGRSPRLKGPTMYATNLEEPIGPQDGSTFLGPQGTSLQESSRKQGTVAAYALHSVT